MDCNHTDQIDPLDASVLHSFVRNPNKLKDEKRCRRAAVRTYDLHPRLPPRRRLRRRPLGRKPKKPVSIMVHGHEHRAGVHPTKSVQPQPEPNKPHAKTAKSEGPALPSLPRLLLPPPPGWRSQNLTVAAPHQTPSRPIPAPRKACRPSCGAVPTPHAVMRPALPL